MSDSDKPEGTAGQAYIEIAEALDDLLCVHVRRMRAAGLVPEFAGRIALTALADHFAHGCLSLGDTREQADMFINRAFLSFETNKADREARPN